MRVLVNEVGMMTREILNSSKMLEETASPASRQSLKKIDDFQINEKPKLHNLLR